MGHYEMTPGRDTVTVRHGRVGGRAGSPALTRLPPVATLVSAQSNAGTTTPLLALEAVGVKTRAVAITAIRTPLSAQVIRIVSGFTQVPLRTTR